MHAVLRVILMLGRLCAARPLLLKLIMIMTGVPDRCAAALGASDSLDSTLSFGRPRVPARTYSSIRTIGVSDDGMRTHA